MSVMGFAFQNSFGPLPSSPYRSRICASPRRRSCRIQWQSSLVAVAGATGGVGTLVVKRLLASIVADRNGDVNENSPLQAVKVTGVRALVRDEARARGRLPQDNEALTFFQVASTDPDRAKLREAMRDVEVLVICTGTTAFPTRSWRNGNTPTAVDDCGVKSLVSALDFDLVKRVVLLSSIGTKRASSLPFAILNAFGVMDAKRRGELHVERAAKRYGFSYAIIRPGRLIGAPHSNIGMMKKEPHPQMMDIEIAQGDALAGDLSRSAAADAVFIASKWDTSADLSISLVHRKGPSPVTKTWESLLKKVEIRRRVRDPQLS